MEANMVEEWLRSLDLVQYTQAFLDNGYDDLEICKQIGQPDLDAIGVKTSVHRYELLKAVDSLREQGATAVYFTLEELQNGDDSGFQENPSCESHVDSPARLSRCYDSYDAGKNTLVSYPKLQLNLMIQNRLRDEDINLTDYPYCAADGETCVATVQPLALRYAEDFNTHYFDVLERMDDIKRKRLMCDTDSSKNSSAPTWEVHNQCTDRCSPRGVAPPLPATPPPIACHNDVTMRTVGTPRSGHTSGADSPNLEPSEHDGGRRGSGLGKLLRGTLRRSGRKYSYKQHEGDLAANEITMPEQERIELMLMVKDGRISLEDAMATLKNYEDSHRPQRDENKENKKDKNGKLSTRRKRKNNEKRTRSQSDGSDARSLSCSPNRGASELNDLSRNSTPQKGPNNLNVSRQITTLAQCVRQHSFESGVLPPHLRDPVSRNPSGGIRSMPTSPCHSSRTSSVSSIGNASPQSARSAANSSPLVQKKQFSRKNSAPPMMRTQPSPDLVLAKSRSQSPCVHSHSPSPVNDRIAPGSGLPVCQLSPNASQEVASPLTPRRNGHPLEDPPALPPRNKPHPPSPRTNAKITHHAQVHATSNEAMETRSVVESDRSSVQSPLEDDSRSISTMSVGSDTSPVADRKHKVLERLRSRSWRSASSCGEDINSSDYEDQDEFDQNLERSGVQRDSFNDKLKNEVRKKFSQMQSLSMTNEIMEVANKHASGSSSGESAPSSSSCNKRSHSSTSTEEDTNQTSSYVCRARALADYMPEGQDKNSLTLKKGDVINVIERNPSGLWTGILKGQTGTFKLVDVEMLSEDTPKMTRRHLKHSSKKRSSKRTKPRTVEELLKRLGLESLSTLFLLHGYDSLEAFSELEQNDLDELNITNPEQRAKLLTAADLVNDLDYDTPDSPEVTPRNQLLDVAHSHIISCESPRRDSGCYASSENLKDRSPPTTVGKSSSKCSSTSEEVAIINGEIAQDMSTQTSNTLEKLEEEKTGNKLSPPTKPKLKPKPLVRATNSTTATSTAINSSVPTSPTKSCTGQPPIPRKPKPQAPARGVSLKSKTSPIIVSTASQGSSVSSTPSVSPSHSAKPHHSPVCSPSHKSGQSLHALKGQHVVLQSFINMTSPQLSPEARSPRAKPPLSPRVSRSRLSPNLLSPSHASRPGSCSIENLVMTKLQQEMIQLAEDPYTDMAGFCGIPPALVLRYAEELGRQDIRNMANAMENVRCHQRKALGLAAVPNDFLGDTCINPIYDNIYSSMEDFLIVNGLPMYINVFHTARFVTLDLIKDMNESHLKKCCVKDPRHVRRLMAAIDALRFYMETKSAQCPHHWKPKVDVMDKV